MSTDKIIFVDLYKKLDAKFSVNVENSFYNFSDISSRVLQGSNLDLILLITYVIQIFRIECYKVQIST